MNLPKMASCSFDPREALLTELRQKFPEVFTEGEIDLEKMQHFLQCTFSDDKDRYRMTWAGRKEAIQQVQVKTTDTLVSDQEQSVDFDSTKNIFIEGDNLEVLRILQKSYYGKVKMIYIDPPYNTGSDFIYHDNFMQNKAQYQRKGGIIDEIGNVVKESVLVKNSKDHGHYHSDWLSMMFPRLYLAKNLLRQDGVIFVSIDDCEVPRLRILMDEIFGEENYLQEIIWKRHAGGGNDSKYFATDHEYILCYAKNCDSIKNLRLPLSKVDIEKYKGKDQHYEQLGFFKTKSFKRMRSDDPRPGLQYEITMPDGQKLLDEWKWEKSNFEKALKENKILLRKDRKNQWTVEYKIYLKSSDNKERLKVPRSLLLDVEKNSEGKRQLRESFQSENIFNNPKPIGLLKYLIKLGCSNNDIILDFFAGSGTTAHAVMQLNAEDGGNRKWICVQLDEVCDQESEAYKAGYKTIADIARERIRRAGKKIQEENKGKDLDVGFKAFHVARSNFPVWQGAVQDERDLLEQMDLFANAQQHDAKSMDLLYELILKEGLDINIDIQLKESKAGSYYLVDQGRLAVSFSFLVTTDLMDAIFMAKPEKLILLESAFSGNDELKINTAFRAQTLKIDIRTI